MRVQIRRFARRDIESAFDWYQERDDDAAVAFLLEIDHLLDRMRQSYEQFPVLHTAIFGGPSSSSSRTQSTSKREPIWSR